PFLQGARLTAWELARDGIPVTVIADGMAGHLLQRGEVDVIVVGADRIAANGDVANKIGTYPLAVLAREHGVPFYVAARLATVDLATPDGAAIPIEERGRDELARIGGVELLPPGVPVRHPAFDVTPHRLVTGIVTERGIVRAPFADALRALCGPAFRARPASAPGGRRWAPRARARRWRPRRGRAGSRAPARGLPAGSPFAHERQGHDAGPRRQGLDGRAAGPLGRRHGARAHAHAALRPRRLRGHPLLSHGGRALGRVPARRARATARRVGAHQPDERAVLARGAGARNPRHARCQRARRGLHPAARLRRARRDGAQSRRQPGARRDRR